MDSYDLSIEKLEEIAEKHDMLVSDNLVGVVADVIVMVLNDLKNEGEKHE